MRVGRPSAALALLFVAATVGTCVFPTERDDAVHVTIDPLPVLIRGTDTVATAHAYANGSQKLANVTFVWSSDDPLTAAVDENGHVVGIKSGTTTIRAAAANFDKRALPGAIALRVSNTLEIDSIRPDTVRYGEIVTVYGVGLLDTLGVGLAIGDGGLIAVPFSEVLGPDGASQISLWVPPPAQTAPMFYIGAGVFGFTADTVLVLRRDLYEPNEIAPRVVNLETSRPFPGTFLNFLLFANPALAFEQLPRDVPVGADWYRMLQSSTRDLTIVLSSEVPGTFQTLLTDSLGFRASDTSYFIGQDAWTFGPGSHSCHGAAFAPKEGPSDSTVVALKDFPAGRLDAITIYTQPGRYALRVSEGYGVTGKGITRDGHEEDDYCNAADAKPAGLPFQNATLTIDNPHDVDWFRFSFAGGVGFRVRTAAPSSALADTSDIDVYLLPFPNPSDTLMTVVASSARAGSDEDIQVLGLLPAGEYYVVVTDFAGVPTRYSLCFGAGTSCDVFPAPLTASAARVQASVARRARLEAAVPRRPLTRVR